MGEKIIVQSQQKNQMDIITKLVIFNMKNVQENNIIKIVHHAVNHLKMEKIQMEILYIH